MTPAAQAPTAVTTPQAATTATLITCSFSGDFDVCRMLCESVDRFVPESIGHILFVPERDIRQFAGLASRRRVIAPQESLLPKWFWKAPLPGPAWRARLRLPRRNVYITPFTAPVRGWIAQQIMKISATIAAPTELVVHVDSDCAFVRPMSLPHLVRDGRARFYANPFNLGFATHRPWFEAAGRLMGLPPEDYYSADYIDQLVVWRRSIAAALVERLQAVAHRDWRLTLARTQHFAEYVLYGVFADHVVGAEAAGLQRTPRSLCHSRWNDPIDDSVAEAEFVAGFQPGHVACLIQSTIPMTADQRGRLFARIERVAARQDAAEPMREVA